MAGPLSQVPRSDLPPGGACVPIHSLEEAHAALTKYPELDEPLSALTHSFFVRTRW